MSKLLLVAGVAMMLSYAFYRRMEYEFDEDIADAWAQVNHCGEVTID